jgi:hypothetical protein
MHMCTGCFPLFLSPLSLSLSLSHTHTHTHKHKLRNFEYHSTAVPKMRTVNPRGISRYISVNATLRLTYFFFKLREQCLVKNNREITLTADMFSS